MSQQASVLIIDDESGILDTLRILLKKEGFEVTVAQGGKAGIDAFRSGSPDIVLTDVRMPQVTGIDVLQAVKEHDPVTPVILMTAQASLQSAMQAVNAGAFYYLQKPFSNAELVALCRRAAQIRHLTTENKTLKREIRRRDSSSAKRPIGRNRAFLEVVRLAETVAPTDSTVLISGESGTGKEVIARFIHELSDRESGPFISINCGALPENLLESELFGHVRGAFSGADRDKPGLFEAADGGTLFLDEVAELPAPLQPKLLRALEAGEVRRVGATTPHSFDVRIIAATNRDIEQRVDDGLFRTDLYWRLNVLHIHMPPLREHPADIPLLAEHFAAGRSIAPAAMALLSAHGWPGNVRELRNTIERAAALSTTGEIHPDDLPPRVQEAASTASRVAQASRRQLPLRELERDYILEVLRSTGGNKSRAAEILGLDRKTLYRKLEEYRED